VVDSTPGRVRWTRRTVGLPVTSEHRFQATESTGDVSAVLVRPREAWCLYVFGHGAGAGMHHAFMEATAGLLAERGIATFRYQFPYMQAGRKVPNRAQILGETVRNAISTATSLAPDLSILAGGKSMGGRMTSVAASTAPLHSVRGLAFFGFPLHPRGRESSERGDHLPDVGLPMLFLQGTRDRLANLDLLRPVLDAIEPAPTLHVVEGADHGFHVLKRSGRTDTEVLEQICDVFANWAGRVI